MRGFTAIFSVVLTVVLSLQLVVSEAGANVSNAKASPPASPVRAVTNEYHGVKVSDPYQWLEKTQDPEVQKWTEAQASYAKSYLEKLPGREKIRAQLKEWNEFQSPTYRHVVYKGGRYFALKLQPPKNQAMIVVLDSVDDLATEKVIVDPNTMDEKGTTAIDWFVPSLDGKYVAVSISKGGSESGTLHIYQTADGKALPDKILRVQNPTAGGSVAWNQDASGLYYTRYPRQGERPPEDMDFYEQVWFHKLGTDEKNDVYSFGKDLPRIAEIFMQTSQNGKYVFAVVLNGDGGEHAHYVLGPKGEWQQITTFKDKITHAELGLNDDLYMVSLEGSGRGKVLRLTLDDPKLANAKTVIPEEAGVIEEILPTPNALYVEYLQGGPSEIKVFSLDGKQTATLAGTPNSSNSGLRLTKGDKILFRSQSYVDPVAWYEYAPEAGKAAAPRKTAMVSKSPVDFSDVEVKREIAKSKDGTLVPMTVVMKKGTKLDKKNPTLLYGYGGYSISLTPRFQPDLRMWLDRGGVYVVANLRGGGEFGESWHLQGNLTKKQNVFDDFIACAEHLIKTGYTTSKRLAIEGGSNGGLLMGAAMTQRPDLFRAVVSHVGIYDMLRVENDPNGAFNVTEFGTVKDPAQFKALYGYSPFHKVKKGVAYPAMLILTGANDGRVNPYHSKKMAARLQSMNTGKPVLLRIVFDGGHGMGRSIAQKVEQGTDVFAFLFNQLDVK